MIGRDWGEKKDEVWKDRTGWPAKPAKRRTPKACCLGTWLTLHRLSTGPPVRLNISSIPVACRRLGWRSRHLRRGAKRTKAKLALCRCRWSTLSTAKRSDLALNFAKPVKSSSRAVLDGGFATVTAVLLQKQWFCLFLFISSESSKNHSKSQKNHKMKNSILLDSTWVDLHSEHII
jgi:hypothetical protein